MTRKELCCCGRKKNHLLYCPLNETGVDSSDIANIEKARKKIKRAAGGKICSCALVNGHLSGCPHKNMIIGGKPITIDFNALAGMLKEMEKKVLEEDASPKTKKTKIFIAPVIKRKKQGRPV